MRSAVRLSPAASARRLRALCDRLRSDSRSGSRTSSGNGAIVASRRRRAMCALMARIAARMIAAAIAIR
jgi:hypothetical protein